MGIWQKWRTQRNSLQKPWKIRFEKGHYRVCDSSLYSSDNKRFIVWGYLAVLGLVELLGCSLGAGLVCGKRLERIERELIGRCDNCSKSWKQKRMHRFHFCFFFVTASCVLFSLSCAHRQDIHTGFRDVPQDSVVFDLNPDAFPASDIELFDVVKSGGLYYCKCLSLKKVDSKSTS